MRVQRYTTKQIITLTDADKLGAGGEAVIYIVPDHPELVAKIWHKPTPERARKLLVMLSNPPSDPMAAQGHASIAWPCDLLLSGGPKQHIVGFIMPRVQHMQPIIDFFNPRTRLQKCPLFNYFYLIRTARNLATAVRAVHERGYVIGDLNESNVLVSDTALVTLVDTDSFQVWDAQNGVMYRCRVGKPEFTPPELQGKTFSQFDREPRHDLFGLGVLIFQLLMEGAHPFAGVYQKQGDPPTLDQRIAAGHFPHGQDPRIPYSAAPSALPFDTLPEVLKHLFNRCFRDGHLSPAQRPDTLSWQFGLEDAEKALVLCWDNDQHVYPVHLTQCPWCQRKKLLGGRDPFPSPRDVKEGKHLAPPPAVRTQPATSRGPRRITIPPAGGSLPPIPRPIPASPSSTRASRRGSSRNNPIYQAFGTVNRNDIAWAAIILSVIVWLMMLLPAHYLVLKFLVTLLSVLAGIGGEIHAHSWWCDGRGRWLARSALALSALAMFILLRG